MFNESTLESAIMDLLSQKGYEHFLGDQIHKEKSDYILEEDLKKYLLTNYPISINEANSIIKDIKSYEKYPLYDANKKFCYLLSNGFDFKRENPNDKDIHINLINYNNSELDKNIFKVINQLEFEENHLRIPDGVIYINGIPLVIFEFKSAIKENTTIMDAYEQLTIRYKRDIPSIFKYNVFCVISDGVNSKMGSFFSDYEYFYAWRRIDDSHLEKDGIASLNTMIDGLFDKERLLNVIKNFVFFPDTSQKNEKIVCRYPQFYAANMLLKNIKKNMKPNGSGKGGTYFGATGSGKSYTMLYLTRLLMKDVELKNPTIVLITDRTDLDDQLAKTFENATDFIGDKQVMKVADRDELKRVLSETESGGVYLTTIQKFCEEFNLLSSRNNIVCISDEAHRSQTNIDKNYKISESEVKVKYGFAKYLHDSLPNATYVGFSGTPIDATMEVFGEIVDSYTMKDSVRDEITVNITYEGRSAKVLLDDEKIKEVEKYYELCAREGANEYQIEESKKATTHLSVIVGDHDVLSRVAEDIISHYEKRVFENATVNGKAMIVCMNRYIAYDLYKILIEKRPDWAIPKKADNYEKLSKKEQEELFDIPKLNLVMTEDSNDVPELHELLGNKSYRKKLDKQFKNEKSNFKIAIVVDMWVTGFDVPSLDTMYIDKPLQDHTLIQTISRVNRKYPGKDKGLIVDYIGIKNRMQLALKKFNKEDSSVFEGLDDAIKVFRDQLDIIDRLFRNFDSTKFFTGSPVEKLDCLNKASEYIQRTEEDEKRFMYGVKNLKSAFNICGMNEQISATERDKMYFYGAVRSIIYKLTKGDAPDIETMNKKVKELIQEALLSDGVEELFEEAKEFSVREVDIFSTDYLNKLDKLNMPNTKIKILQRLLKSAIEEYKKVNKIKGVEFMDRLQSLIDNYNDRSADEKFAMSVLEDVADELTNLMKELEDDKNSFRALGIDFEEKAFLDILFAVSVKYDFEYDKDKMIELSKRIKKIVTDKSKYTDWAKKENIKAELQQDLIILLDEFDYPPVTNDVVYEEVLAQAENFKKYN